MWCAFRIFTVHFLYSSMLSLHWALLTVRFSLPFAGLMWNGVERGLWYHLFFIDYGLRLLFLFGVACDFFISFFFCYFYHCTFLTFLAWALGCQMGYEILLLIFLDCIFTSGYLHACITCTLQAVQLQLQSHLIPTWPCFKACSWQLFPFNL